MVRKRIEFFHENGCIVSDHGLDSIVHEETTSEELNKILKKRLNKEDLTQEEIWVYKGNLLIWLGKEYNKRNWVMQLHIGAIRNNSTRLYEMLGPDTGFDSIGDTIYARKLSKILDELDKTNELPNPYKVGSLNNILSNKFIFGINLVEIGMAEKIENYFLELISEKNSVRKIQAFF